jgi:hypothetical protein
LDPRLLLLEHVEYSDDRILRRLLVKGSESERLILSSVVRPREGLANLTVLDDVSGWSASMRQESGLKFASSAELAQPGVWALRFTDREQPLRWTFEAPRVSSFSLDSTTWDQGFAERYSVAFESVGLREPLLLALPGPAKHVLSVLGPVSESDTGVGTPVGAFRDLLTFLSRQLGDPPGETSDQWTVSMEMTHPGAGPRDELERALVGAFSSIEKEDLLSDLRVIGQGLKRP